MTILTPTKGGRLRKLVIGDNLGVLRQILDESVDLAIMDPPFEITAEGTYTPPEFDISGIGDFHKIWGGRPELDPEARRRLEGLQPACMELFPVFQRSGGIAMKKFQEFVAVRMAETVRVLKRGGSLYIQSRSRGAHYTKILVDTMMEHGNFQDEICWVSQNPYLQPGGAKIGDTHETILHYTKGESRASGASSRPGDRGNLWVVDEGFNRKLKTDTPTEIYERMLERSAQKGDLVLDPFCGGGSSLLAAEAAEAAECRWLGIDEWNGAGNWIRGRFEEFGMPNDFEVMG